MPDRINGCSTLLALQVEDIECGTQNTVELDQDDFFYFHDYAPQGVSLTTASSPDACLMLARTYVTGKVANAGSFGGSLLHESMCVPLYAAFGAQGANTTDLDKFIEGVFTTAREWPTITLAGDVESWTLFEHDLGCETTTNDLTDSEGKMMVGTQLTGFSLTSSMGAYVTAAFPFIGAEMDAIGDAPANPMDSFHKPVPTEFFNDDNSTITITATTGSDAWPTDEGCDYIDFSFDLTREITVAPACRSAEMLVSGCNNVSGGKVTGTLSMYMSCGADSFHHMEKYVNGENTYNIKFDCIDAEGNFLLFDIKKVAWTSATPTWEQNGSRMYEMAFEATLDDDIPGGDLMTLTHGAYNNKAPKIESTTPTGTLTGAEGVLNDIEVRLEFDGGPATTVEVLLESSGSILGPIPVPATSGYGFTVSVELDNATADGKELTLVCSNSVGSVDSAPILCTITVH